MVAADCTAWKAVPGIDLSSSRFSSDQRRSEVPEMNQLEPLSATIRPYCFIAAAMTCAGPVIPEMSYAAPSRSRRPIGGAVALEVSPAQWDAGWIHASCVELTVTRIAWLMWPEAASSYRTRPGKIGSPAASAEVKPSGRRAAERRSQITPTSAFQWGFGFLRANARPS